ncbi:MAG: branched-chain amino acid aminotransferase [Bacteroidota bacterium]
MNSLHSSIEVTQVNQSRLPQVDLINPGFGRIFSDHMFEMEYRNGAWQTPRIKPYGTIEVTPALNIFHYGQSVFEGMKAYYADEHTVNLFRPEMNIKRMRNSCQRMCIPPVDSDLFMEALEQLIKLDHQWIPNGEGQSLYVRPFAMAFEPWVAAHTSNIFRFYILTSPVGSYYTDPVKLTTMPEYIRAAQGGTGSTKTAGNYAASMYPAKKAKEQGFDQVLWLDAMEHKYVEEVGTMNIFFLIDGTLVTRELSGTILPGVTRDSVIQLAKYWDIPVEQRKLSIHEVMEAGQNGTLQEVFGAGTAAVIAPVQSIHHQGDTVQIHEEGRGPLAQRLYDAIYGMQTGKKEDPFGWVHRIEVD